MNSTPYIQKLHDIHKFSLFSSSTTKNYSNQHQIQNGNTNIFEHKTLKINNNRQMSQQQQRQEFRQIYKLQNCSRKNMLQKMDKFIEKFDQYVRKNQMLMKEINKNISQSHTFLYHISKQLSSNTQSASKASPKTVQQTPNKQLIYKQIIKAQEIHQKMNLNEIDQEINVIDLVSSSQFEQYRQQQQQEQQQQQQQRYQQEYEQQQIQQLNRQQQNFEQRQNKLNEKEVINQNKLIQNQNQIMKQKSAEINDGYQDYYIISEDHLADQIIINQIKLNQTIKPGPKKSRKTKLPQLQIYKHSNKSNAYHVSQNRIALLQISNQPSKGYQLILDYPMRYYFPMRTFKIKILHSMRNNIQIGILDRGNCQTKYSHAAITYHGQSAIVRDWKNSYRKGKGFKEGDFVQVRVYQGQVKWVVNGVQEANLISQKLTKKYLTFFPFIQARDKGDSVQWVQQ